MVDTNEQLKVLERLGDARVLVVGDVMLDRYWWGSASRLSPEAPVPVVALKEVSHRPGGAANVAANIVGIGTKVALAGVTGPDESGGVLRNTLEDNGIDCSCLITSSTRKTTTKTRVLVHSQQIARVDDESHHTLSGSDENSLCEAIVAAIGGVDAIVVSDYAKGCLTEKVLASVTQNARSAGKPVVVDPKSRDLSKYDGATLLTPNLAEALNAADLPDKNEDHASDAAAAILNKVSVDALLITLGEHGMKLYRRESGERHFPSLARQVFDVTGAGDTVVAVLTAALAAQASIEDAISLANIAAGLVVEKVGTSTITIEELRSAITEQSLHRSMER